MRYLIEDKITVAENWDSVIRDNVWQENFIPNDRFEMIFPYLVPRAVSANEFYLLSLSLSFFALIIVKLPVFVWKVLLPRDNTWILFECSRLSPASPPKEWCNLADAFSYLSYLSAGRGRIYNWAGINCEFRMLLRSFLCKLSSNKVKMSHLAKQKGAGWEKMKLVFLKGSKEWNVRATTIFYVYIFFLILESNIYLEILWYDNKEKKKWKKRKESISYKNG